MKSFKAFVLALFCLAVIAVPTAGASRSIVPSREQAIYAVKVELLNHFIALMDTTRTSGPDLVAKAQVGCDPLTNTLWRCTWIGKSRLFYDVTGMAKVRFYTYASDVSLYNVKCYNTTQVDNCGSALRRH
jgi:hypothetical protein